MSPAAEPGDTPVAPSAPVETDRDPGLQPERTRLAWRRTTLSCAVTALLAMRHALRSDRGVVLGAVVLCLEALGFLGILGTAHLRIGRLSTSRPPVLSARAALTLAGCTTALALLGLVLVS